MPDALPEEITRYLEQRAAERGHTLATWLQSITTDTEEPAPMSGYDARVWETYRRDAGCGCTAPDPDDCGVDHSPLPGVRPEAQWAFMCVCHRLARLDTPATHATRPQERPGAVGAGVGMPDTESGAQTGAEPSWPDYVIVSQYRHPETGVYVWAARCWGADQCRGAVSLGHDSERWAEVALARHLSEEHGVDVDLPEPAAALGDGRDCPACDAGVPHAQCCPTPETHNAGCVDTPDPGDGLPGKRPFSSPPQDPTANLLRDAERYLSALHTRAGRHEILGADFTCAGCQLADRIRQHLDGTGTPPDAVGLVRPEQVLAELRTRFVVQHKGAMAASAASTGDTALIHDGSRMGLDVAVAELDALALRLAEGRSGAPDRS